MNKKTVIRTLLVIVSVIVIVLLGSSIYFLDFALNPATGVGRNHYSENAAWATFKKKHPELKHWADSIRTKAMKKTWLVNADGDSIRVYYFPAAKPTSKTVVLAHGYTDCGICMLHIGYLYNHDLGYNVLTYDQYAHGESQGKIIQMGWKDRKNLIECTNLADKLFSISSPKGGGREGAVLHGISMGGATVMMASGDPDLPKCVRAIVDDCGYTSVWDEFSSELKNQFGLPDFPLMYVTSAMCKLLYGWSFGEASALESVSKAKVPILFIHGSKDHFVPTSMVYSLYKACPTRKVLWIAPNSTHAKSYDDHPKEYTEKTKEFLIQLSHVAQVSRF